MCHISQQIHYIADACTERYNERVGGRTGGYTNGMLFRATGPESKILHLTEQILRWMRH